jgi:hypothetical protein
VELDDDRAGRRVAALRPADERRDLRPVARRVLLERRDRELRRVDLRGARDPPRKLLAVQPQTQLGGAFAVPTEKTV